VFSLADIGNEDKEKANLGMREKNGKRDVKLSLFFY
jgi:hypothetical protein